MNQSKDWVKELEYIMERLRAPDGCPWDQEQDHVSLKPYLIEESCEVLDAIDENNMNLLKEELGDVLMNLVFHAQLAKEKNYFNFQDVARAISEKMVNRHPHVFGDSDAVTAEDVEKQWQEIKKKEKAERESVLDGIPKSLPPLQRAFKIQKKAAKTGFDWANLSGVLDKIKEEVNELEEAVQQKDKQHIQEELGDLIFSLVNYSRHLEIDAGDALNSTNNKFIRRFTRLEKICKKEGKDLAALSLQEMDEIWDRIKLSEK